MTLSDTLAPTPIPPPPVGTTPLKQRDALHKRLIEAIPEYQRFSAYYDGRQSLKFASAKFRAIFGGLFDRFADNWCALVVDAAGERIEVQGFRYPNDPTDVMSGDEEAFSGDADAWAIWQSNDLDAASQILHTEAMINRNAYVMVWPDKDGDPGITIESPEQMILAYEAGTREKTAGWKEWHDEDSGKLFGTLYRPDNIYKFQSQNKVDPGQLTALDKITWVQRTTGNEAWPLRNPFGEVPIVCFENRPRLLRGGISEIASVIPLQDAINKVLVDMLVASEFQSYRQRWATGLELDTDPETGVVVEPFKSAIERLWTTADGNVKFGEFGTVDLTGFVSMVELLVQHVASQTRTPPHYFYLSGQFPSGEALVAAEAGLVAKAKLKMRHFGESWEEVMRLAFAATDDPRAQIETSETIWADPESRNPAVVADAAVKMSSVGVPQEAIWEYLGFSPVQIARFKAIQAAQPPPPPPAPPQAPPNGQGDMMSGDMMSPAPSAPSDGGYVNG